MASNSEFINIFTVAIVKSIKENVTDPKIRLKIMKDITEIVLKAVKDSNESSWLDTKKIFPDE